MRHLIVLLFLLAILSVNKSIAQSGKLDSSFGTKGKLMLKLFADSSNQHIYYVSMPPVTIQADYKIIVCITKNYTEFGSDKSLVEIRRYYPDGITDSSFGTNGVVTFPYSRCSDLKLRSDGKILLAVDGGSQIFQVIQLNPDGNIDTSFSYHGRTTIFSSDGYCVLQLLPDNKFLATTEFFSVTKFTENGIVDSSFGVNGKSSGKF